MSDTHKRGTTNRAPMKLYAKRDKTEKQH